MNDSSAVDVARTTADTMPWDDPWHHVQVRGTTLACALVPRVYCEQDPLSHQRSTSHTKSEIAAVLHAQSRVDVERVGGNHRLSH